MIYLFGTLYNIASNPVTDRKTGEISMVHTAEVLHTSRGKTEIASVKLNDQVVEGWQKCKGREITVEVRFYAMKTTEGGIMSGLTLADKNSLPTVEPIKKTA